jgi:hypothetical protein
LINPASRRGTCCGLPWEIGMASMSQVGMKERGTAGKPGGNRENNAHPVAMTRTKRGEISSDGPAEVSRGHRRPTAGKAREAPQGRQAGQPIGSAVTRAGRRPERCPERGLQERRGRFVASAGHASVRPLELPLEAPGAEAVTGTGGEDAPVAGADRLARVLEADTLRRALPQVRRHQGAPGVDGMTVDDLGAYVKIHWPRIRAAWLAGT